MYSRQHLLQKIEHIEAFAKMLLVIAYHLREYLEEQKPKEETRKTIQHVLSNRLKKLNADTKKSGN